MGVGCNTIALVIALATALVHRHTTLGTLVLASPRCGFAVALVIALAASLIDRQIALGTLGLGGHQQAPWLSRGLNLACRHISVTGVKASSKTSCWHPIFCT